MTEEQKEWYDSRPESVKKLIDELNIMTGIWFRYKKTGQIGKLYSITEHGDDPCTVKLVFPTKYNIITTKDRLHPQEKDGFDRMVFGLKPSDLEPIDPPEGES